MADNRTDKLPDPTKSHGELTEGRPEPAASRKLGGETLSRSAPGDDRTPDKTIGQIKYADHGGKPADAKRQKPETPPDSDSMGGGSQGGM
jgi:hypothetical protein